jgi:PAS domain-containing protein
VRLLSLIINFSVPTNLNYVEMTGLSHTEFLGQRIAVAEGIRSSWTRVGELSSLLMLVFVLDASIACWRRGDRDDRRKAVTVGGSIVMFILLAAGHGAMLHRGLVQAPYFISLPFSGIILAMAYELTRDVLRAGGLSRELTESEERMELAVHAGGLSPWSWNVREGTVWGSENFARLFGFASQERIDFRHFFRARTRIGSRPSSDATPL